MLSNSSSASRFHCALLAIIALITLGSLSSCADLFGGDQGTKLEETRIALAVMQTQFALQQQSPVNPPPTVDLLTTQVAIAAAQTQLALPQQPTPDFAATQVAQSVQLTLQAQPQPQPQATQPPATAPSLGDFDTWKRNASILLYEDMAGAEASGTYESFRYVKKTLDSMGLRYVDTLSGIGLLKSQINSSGPAGKGWDLVIIAAERKSTVSGEYFTDLIETLNRGASAILEVWYLDQVSQGAISPLLSRCGVQVYKDFIATTINDEAMFIMSGDHPIMYSPRSGFRFSNVTSYWPLSNPPVFTLDLGDLMILTGTGDAQFLAGQGSDPSRNGTVTVCLGGQFILQTFSSHQVAYSEMALVWENYIHNALLNRYTRLGGG